MKNLTINFSQDERSGDYTAKFLEIPNASAQGRTKEEAEKLLRELLPHITVS